MQDIPAETRLAFAVHHRSASDHPSRYGPLRTHSAGQHLLELPLPLQLLQEILADHPINHSRPDGRSFGMDRLHLLLRSFGHQQALPLVQRKTRELASSCLIFARKAAWLRGLLGKIIQCMIY